MTNKGKRKRRTEYKWYLQLPHFTCSQLYNCEKCKGDPIESESCQLPNIVLSAQSDSESSLLVCFNRPELRTPKGGKLALFIWKETVPGEVRWLHNGSRRLRTINETNKPGCKCVPVTPLTKYNLVATRYAGRISSAISFICEWLI